MNTSIRHFVRAATSIAAVASVAALTACGAAPDQQEGQGSAQNDVTVVVTVLPEAECTLVAGVSGPGGRPVRMKIGGGSTDPAVTPFQNEIHAIPGAGAGYYTISTGISPSSPSWYAIDVSHVSSAYDGTLTSDVNANTAAPIQAGLYECTYLVGDYQLQPGQKPPYMPAVIVAYDPRACGNCPI
jgi:hypothetical protein